jgi:DNA end-binding protein Ku
MAEEEEEPSPKRPIWTGTVTIGLVNVPVKLYAMIYDKGVSFRFLHKLDGQPLKYERVCTKENKVVPWDEVVRGYEVAKNKS